MEKGGVYLGVRSTPTAREVWGHASPGFLFFFSLHVLYIDLVQFQVKVLSFRK